MSNPLFSWEKKLFKMKHESRKVRFVIMNNRLIFTIIAIAVIGLSARLWSTEPVFFANASIIKEGDVKSLDSPLFKQSIFAENAVNEGISLKELLDQEYEKESLESKNLKMKLYEIVGDAPIREMVPFISQRDEKVAAFLIGIAKKESSFGSRSPLKDGETCYNYWGYKSSGGRGTAMGYACFASAEEAIKIVGDRIEVLVDKKRDTPARMVDTWKCGKSCAGDPGAPSWVSTVALYFNKIVG